MKRVEGKEGLFKDPSTGSVANANVSEYENYKRSKRKNLELLRVVKDHEQRIQRLEQAFRGIQR